MFLGDKDPSGKRHRILVSVYFAGGIYLITIGSGGLRWVGSGRVRQNLGDDQAFPFSQQLPLPGHKKDIISADNYHNSKNHGDPCRGGML